MLPRDCEMNDELLYLGTIFQSIYLHFIKILSALKLYVPLSCCCVWVLGVALLVAVFAHSTLSHNHRRHWQKWWDFDFSVNVSTYLGFCIFGSTVILLWSMEQCWQNFSGYQFDWLQFLENWGRNSDCANVRELLFTFSAGYVDRFSLIEWDGGKSG